MRNRLFMPGRVAAGSALVAVAAVGFAPAAHADSSSSSGQVAGYTVTAEGIGAQFGFDIPNVVPLPDENLIEADTPFARTLVSSGPTVDAIGTPYYPGDILGNFAGLSSEFFPPQFPPAPNWPLEARAQDPPSPAYGPSASFGGTAPTGSPVAPAVFAGQAIASATGGGGTGTATDLQVGPGMGSNGAAALEVAKVTSSDAVTIGSSTVSAVASSVLRAIDIAGMIDITTLSSNASSSSDGTTGTPTATLHLGQVTVDGQPAYIDNQGVHVQGNSTSSTQVTPALLQETVDNTLAQDGISVRLLDPQQTVNGAEAVANSGGLVVAISHNFYVPFTNTGTLTNGAVQPCAATQNIIPNQELLGNACLPSGNYTAVTSITLGLASTDVNASAVQPLGSSTGSTQVLGSFGTGSTTAPTPSSLGLSAFGSNGQTTVGSPTGPGTVLDNTSGPQSLAVRLLHFPIRGVPAPVGWIVLAMILCVIFTYPMMLAARWQFLSGRR
ncbi:MAG: hypothetical protein ACYDB3_02970 [Acidimicrobiales bacterium]